MMKVKLKAGALQLTMFIIVVIALLLAAFILFIHTYDRFKIQTDFAIEVIDNANEGIRYTLQNAIVSKDTTYIELQDEPYKTLKVQQDYWGFFEKVTSTAKIKKNRYTKAALLGGSQPETDRMALYLEDQNKPLVLVGNTRIQGVAYLPQQGVRTGHISGHAYYGNQLVYGTIKESSQLPKIEKETLRVIKNLSKVSAHLPADQYLEITPGITYENSFFRPRQVVYSQEDITLSNIRLTGHILVQSETKITLEAGSKLTDVVLVAPEIIIEDFVNGAFQAIATKRINVGQHCNLAYPSALVVYENESREITQTISNNMKTPFIKVSKGSHVKGVIAFFSQAENQRTQVFIDEGTTIMGEVYCNQILELLGTVNGSVLTSGFVSNQSGSSYQNHLYDATISIDDLPREYVGLSFENSKKGIIKWLY